MKVLGVETGYGRMVLLMVLFSIYGGETTRSLVPYRYLYADLGVGKSLNLPTIGVVGCLAYAVALNCSFEY